MSKTANAYMRGGGLICVPCSDIEDREHPREPWAGARCWLCDEPLDDDEFGPDSAQQTLERGPR
jgi:hypothetical protein